MDGSGELSSFVLLLSVVEFLKNNVLPHRKILPSPSEALLRYPLSPVQGLQIEKNATFRSSMGFRCAAKIWRFPYCPTVSRGIWQLAFFFIL
jgi:hypothetical protein